MTPEVSAKRSFAGLPVVPRRLGDVVREVPGARLVDPTQSDVMISGVHHDSRLVEAGDLFVARPGARVHGARFIAEAVARGARAVLLAPGDVSSCGAARVESNDVPRALAFAAAAVYGHPTFSLEVVGITGTNGKTTTASLVQAAIDATGGRAGIVGTLGYRFGDLSLPATHTSPEADELTRIAASMLAKGATHLVMEVSSIALAAARADAVHFRVAVFTNFTQDHLDYHGSMEAYGAAKSRLFFELGPGAAAINVDDGFGARLAERILSRGAPRLPLVRYSADPTRTDAEVAPISIAHRAEGIEIVARTPHGPITVRSRLLGTHNAYNLLAAISVGALLDLDLERVAEGLSRPIDVPGRLERCDEPGRDDIVVLVDYAHTPDALARVLESVRPLTRGRIVCLFGCGGDRDAGKRPQMGEAAGTNADWVIVTSDNPRSEDPRAIIDDILPGLEQTKTPFVVEVDRATAIDRAIAEARAGDVVVLAGKGHETYQIAGGTTLAFDDRVEARRALAERRGKR